MNNLLYENASVLIIGNEILSGRTIDKNFNYIATKLGEHGISISESRTVSDSEEEIINAITNQFKSRRSTTRWWRTQRRRRQGRTRLNDPAFRTHPGNGRRSNQYELKFKLNASEFIHFQNHL